MSKAKDKITEYEQQQKSIAQQEMLESLKEDEKAKKNLGVYLVPTIDIAKEYVKTYPQIDSAYETLKNTKIKIGIKNGFANGLIYKYGLTAKGNLQNQNTIKISKYNTYSSFIDKNRKEQNKAAIDDNIGINCMFFKQNYLKHPESQKELKLTALDDFYKLEILCHEMCHNLAKVEYKLFDVVGDEIPLKFLGTEMAMCGTVIKYAGGVKCSQCDCDEKGFPETKHQNKNYLIFRQDPYSPCKESSVSLIHEGMTEYITSKMIKNGVLDKYTQSPEILEEMKSRKRFKSYRPYVEYIGMVDALNPGCIEESYFGGIEKQNIMLDSKYIEYVLGQIYKFENMNLEGLDDAKNLKNFSKNLKKAFSAESDEVQKLYYLGKIQSGDVKRYFEARNKFWSFDNVYYGLMVPSSTENKKLEGEVEKFCQSMQTDTSCDVKQILKAEQKSQEKMIGDMNTRKFFGR